jgi:hypothetical protein
MYAHQAAAMCDEGATAVTHHYRFSEFPRHHGQGVDVDLRILQRRTVAQYGQVTISGDHMMSLRFSGARRPTRSIPPLPGNREGFR